MALRCALDCGIWVGIDGTGGASGALGTPLDGEGSRKVRSDIDPLLPRRSRLGLVDPATELPTDEFEPDLRSIRLVWTSATDMGVVGLDRNAAAAAEAEREALEVWFFRNAWAAAVVAEGFAFDAFRGCDPC